MGVTIHFTGTLRDDAALAGIEGDARRFAVQHRWTVRTVDHASNAAGDYTGISIYPTEVCEPIHLVFDEQLRVDEHVKTQFAGPDTHINIVQLFRQISPWFSELTIDDEGEFWVTGDAAKLQMHMSVVASRLEELATESEDPEIAVRLPSGRILDLRRRQK